MLVDGLRKRAFRALDAVNAVGVTKARRVAVGRRKPKFGTRRR